MGWRWRLQSLLITRSLLRRPQAEAAAVSETSPNEAEDEDEVLNLQVKTHEGWAEPQRECVAVLRKLWGGPAPPLLGVCVSQRTHSCFSPGFVPRQWRLTGLPVLGDVLPPNTSTFPMCQTERNRFHGNTTVAFRLCLPSWFRLWDTSVSGRALILTGPFLPTSSLLI